MSTHNLCFEQKYEKYQIFLFENFSFLVVNFSIYLNRHDSRANGVDMIRHCSTQSALLVINRARTKMDFFFFFFFF